MTEAETPVHTGKTGPAAVVPACTGATPSKDREGRHPSPSREPLHSPCARVPVTTWTTTLALAVSDNTWVFSWFL